MRGVTPTELDELLFAPGGRVVAVAMASWCGPCKEELPDLIRVYEEFKDKGLVLYGLSLDFEGPEAIRPLAEAMKVPFPILWIGEEGMRRLELFPIPMALFIRDGRITQRVAGKNDAAELRGRFADFLK